VVISNIPKLKRMDRDLEMIESLLTGSPARLRARKSQTNLLRGVMDENNDNQGIKLDLTMSDDTTSIASSWESPHTKDDLQRHFQVSTPSQHKSSFAMKTPGLAIPTPALSRLKVDPNQSSQKFYDAYDSFDGELKVQASASSEALVGFDDTAFLPDDFCERFNPIRIGNENFQFSDSEERSSSPSVQLQAKMDEALERTKKLWIEQTKQEFEKEITERVQKEAQEELEKHGAAWSAEHEEEVAKLQSQMDTLVEARKAELEREIVEEMEVIVKLAHSNYENMVEELVNQQKSKVADLQNASDHMKNCFETENRDLKDRVAELELEHTTFKGNSANVIQGLQEKIDLLEKNTVEGIVLMKAEHGIAIQEIEDYHTNQRSKCDSEHKIAIENVKKALELECSLSLDHELNLLRFKHEEAIASISSIHQNEVESLNNRANTKYAHDISELNTELKNVVAIHVEKAHRMNAEAEELKLDIQQLRSSIDDLLSQEKQVRNDLQMQYEVQISQLHDDFNSQRMLADAKYKAEMHTVVTELATARQSLVDAFEVERKELQERINHLVEKASTSSAIEAAAIEKMEMFQMDEVARMKADFDEAHCSYFTQCDDEKRESHKKIQVLEIKLLSLSADYSTQIDKMLAQHEAERLQSKVELETQLGLLRVQLEYEKVEALSQHLEPSIREKELIDLVSKLEADNERAHSDSQTRVQELRKEHTGEIDELISQLDLVEAENKKVSIALETKMKQKDAIIAALGTQLAEATSRSSELDAEHQTYVDALKAATEEANLTKIQYSTLLASWERSKLEHKKAMDDEKRKRHEARDEVRAEMIAAAEEQFAKANVEYLRLKSEFELTVARLGKAEREIQAMSIILEVARKEQATKEMDMAAELAQAKAVIATNEANSARKVQEYTIVVERLNATQRDMQTKLDESNENCKAAHLSLGSIVAEKEKLVLENKDLKEVCEELMAMVEADKLS